MPKQIGKSEAKIWRPNGENLSEAHNCRSRVQHCRDGKSKKSSPRTEIRSIDCPDKHVGTSLRRLTAESVLLTQLTRHRRKWTQPAEGSDWSLGPILLGSFLSSLPRMLFTPRSSPSQFKPPFQLLARVTRSTRRAGRIGEMQMSLDDHSTKREPCQA